ncbi:MAG: AAA family ATPase [Thermoanaerobaculaceae bacterium]|nr:AAA family ATPase [Thermoanaerobaculaceae bacterium]
MSTMSKPVSTSSPEEPFPVRRIDEIQPQDSEKLWLIDDLWLREGVGMLGAPPKHYKTWLAVEIALSVSTGSPALGRYPVREPGPVLFFGAEDRLPLLRARFDATAQARDITLDQVPLYLLDVTALRLETREHLCRLEATLERYRPRLLVLDPLVRIATLDENSAAEVSAVLGALRQLQRRFQVAVLLVHHTRKAAGSSATQAFRGSGDFGAWSDSNLIIRSRNNELVLSLEHRSAPAPAPLVLHFRTEPTPHLALLPASDTAPKPPADELEASLLACLPKTGVARPTTDVREQIGRRKADVLDALRRLQQRGLVEHTKTGWRRTGGPSQADAAGGFPVPHMRDGHPGTRESPADPTSRPSAELSAEGPSGGRSL